MRGKRKGQGTAVIGAVGVVIVVAVLLAVSTLIVFQIDNTLQATVVNETLGTGAAEYTVAQGSFVVGSETVRNDSTTLSTGNYTTNGDNGIINITEPNNTGVIFADYTSGKLQTGQSSTLNQIFSTTNDSLSLLVVILIVIAAAVIISIVMGFVSFGGRR